MLQTTSKEDQKVVLKKLKEEQRRKMALLGEQYEQTIAEMLQKQSVRFADICLDHIKELMISDPTGRVPGARGKPAGRQTAA